MQIIHHWVAWGLWDCASASREVIAFCFSEVRFDKNNCSYTLSSILISLLNYLGSSLCLVKIGRAPLTLLLQYADLPKEDTACIVETLQGGDVYCLCFHTVWKKITLCVVVICMYVSNLSSWFLHWDFFILRIIGGMIWGLQTSCAKRGHIVFPDSFCIQWYCSLLCERRTWPYLPRLDCSLM